MQAAIQNSLRHNAVEEILIARFICVNLNKILTRTGEDLKKQSVNTVLFVGVIHFKNRKIRK